MAKLVEQYLSISFTPQVYFDLGLWLSIKPDYNQQHLSRLQSEESYLPLIALANEYWLIGPLTNQLKYLDILQTLPTQLQSYLIELEKLYLQRSLAIQQETIFVCNLLNQANIEVAILKGAASLFNGTLKAMSNRYMSDIDLLVSEDQHLAAERILKENGYANQSGNLTINANGHHHSPPLIRDNAVCYVELHRRPLKRSVNNVLLESEIWRHAVPLDLNKSLQVSQLHPTHQVILAIAHSELQDSGYQENHLDLRQLLNLQFIAAHYAEQIDWNSVQSHFARVDHLAALNSILFKAKQLLGLQTPITNIDNSESRKHFVDCIQLNTRPPKQKRIQQIISSVLSGYKREAITDNYGYEGNFPVFQGRLRHLKRHIKMLTTTTNNK